MTQWTFITNHAAVLSIINEHPRITAREMAGLVGITERAVRKIIADLETNGYIAKKKEGRRVKYTVNPTLKLRHRTHREKAIGDLLTLLGLKNSLV